MCYPKPWDYSAKLAIITVCCMAVLNCTAQPPDITKPHHTPGGFRNVHA